MTYAAGLGRGFVIGARSFQFLGERWKEVLQVRVVSVSSHQASATEKPSQPCN